MFRSILARYRLLSPGERRSWLLLTLIGLAMALVETAVGSLVYTLVAHLTNPSGAASRPLLRLFLDLVPSQTVLGQTLGLLALTGLIHFARNGLAFVLTRTHLRLSTEAGFALSCRLFAQYLRSPWAFHLKRHSAELATHVQHTSAGVFRILNSVTGIITYSLTAVGLSGLVPWVSPWPTIATAFATCLILWVFLRTTRRAVESAGIAERGLDIEATRQIQEGFGSVKEVKILGREAFFTEAYRRTKMASLAISLKMHSLGAVPQILVEIIFGLGILSAVVAAALSGHPSLTALLSLYVYAGIRVIPAVLSAAREAALARNYIALTEPVLLDLAEATRDESEREALRLRDTVEFDDVSFFYPGTTRAALRRVSVRIRRGEFLGIVGLSGAGKTTFGDILLGLLSPSTGTVRVDGVSRPAGSRLAAGYVPQQVFLVDDTLARNIAFARPDDEIDARRLQSVIALSRLEGVVAHLEHGAATKLGERGARLAGGERQRVAIARALYDDPDLLLLDEATSSLDPATEQELLTTLTGLKGAHTIVMISHRLSTVRACERILVLQEGALVGEGTYAELARGNAAFRSWAGLR